ncbi:MAG TPA: cupin domain-containing protein [Kofleriaceae bacterium]|nr:cupin domain-containing protein [Kofleriaceae bacterium]
MSEVRGRKRTIWIVGVVCAVAGLATGAMAGGQKASVIVPIADAKFMPMDPAMPAGPAVAALDGDPTKGKSSVLLKLKKGSAPLHIHSADYHAVLVSGQTKHWDKGQDEKSAKTLGPGSYWFQPGKQPHGDACLTDECIIYVTWAGKMDMKLADAPK